MVLKRGAREQLKVPIANYPLLSQIEHNYLFTSSPNNYNRQVEKIQLFPLQANEIPLRTLESWLLQYFTTILFNY